MGSPIDDGDLSRVGVLWWLQKDSHLGISVTAHSWNGIFLWQLIYFVICELFPVSALKSQLKCKIFYHILLAILLSSLLFEFVLPQFNCCPWDISRGNLKEWLGQGVSSFISTNNCPSCYWHLLGVLLSCISAMGGQGVPLPEKIQHLADIKCQSL